MASDTMNYNPEVRKFDKSIEIGVSRSSSSSSSSSSRLQSHRRRDRFFIQNRENFGRSGPPVRVMFYGGGMWVDFPSQVVEPLRSYFSARKSVVGLVVRESNCVFDFFRMLQIDLNSKNRRSIAWIDDDGKCFFPKEFVSYPGENMVVEIEIQVEAVSKPKSEKRTRETECERVKEEEEEEVTSSFGTGDSPKRRRLESLKWPNVKLLGEGDEAYVRFRDRFLPAIKKVDPQAAITAVHQCTPMGPMAKARQGAFAKQMEITKTARGSANVVHAWYPASAQSVSDVMTFGFGASNDGSGLRLSSLDFPCEREVGDDGEKYLILCAVILGNLEKVEADSRQLYPSSAEFDTGADDLRNPKWYLVWPTNVSRHILPKCVASYKSRDRSAARLEEPTRRKYTFMELFAKLKSSISPDTFQECMTLYKTMKAGKTTKDIFIKQFRDVAGEKVLLSAIREICGSV